MGKKLVYLVDDEPLILKAMDRVLRRLSLEVRAFTDPAVALAAARDAAPDLVVTDLALGSNMDGLSLIDALRKLSPLRTLLISGGSDSPEVADRAIQSGQLDAFLRKPWDATQLSSTVASLLGIDLSTASTTVVPAFAQR